MALRLAMSTSASSAMVCCGRSQMMRYPKSLPAIGGKGMPVPPVPPLDALAAHWWPLDAMTDPRASARRFGPPPHMPARDKRTHDPGAIKRCLFLP